MRSKACLLAWGLQMETPGTWLVLLLIVLVCLGLTAYRLDEPVWESGHHGFHMTEYPHNARNFVRFGYLDTKLGLVMNYGSTRPASYHYRIDHGFVTPLLISLSYRLFGIHNWSGRLVSLLSAASLSLLVYALAAAASTNRRVALLAAAFTALSPILIYYGRMPAPHTLAVPFCMLVALCYWRWFESEKSGWFAAVMGLLVLGAFVDWISYFISPAIALHYFFYTRRRRWGVLLALGLAPFGMFGLYILWSVMLRGQEALHVLWDIFLMRSASGYEAGVPLSFGYYLRHAFQSTTHWLTYPVVLLSLAWLLVFLYRTLKSRTTASDGLIAALFVFGLAHNLVFRNLVMIHDFAMNFHLIPAVALAAADLLGSAAAYLQPRSRWGAVLLVLTVGCLFMGHSLSTYVTEHRKQEIEVLPIYLGLAVHELVSETGHFIDAANLYKHAGILRSYDTADRPYRFAMVLADVLPLLEHPRYEVVVAHDSYSDPELLAYLFTHFPWRRVGGYALFEVGKGTSAAKVSMQIPQLMAKDESLDLGNDVRFLGFTVSDLRYQEIMQPSLLQRYLVRHAAWLPKYWASFVIDGYWEDLGDTDRELELQIELRATTDTMPADAPSPFDAGLTVARWSSGGVLLETFTQFLVVDDLEGDYTVWVSAQERGKGRAVAACETFEEGHLVRAGRVRVRDGEVTMDPARVELLERVAAVAWQEPLYLASFVQSHQSTHAGDVVRADLVWQLVQPLFEDYRVFIHILGFDGSVRAQHDASPCDGGKPFSAWQPGEVGEDSRRIPLPLDLAPGDSAIRAGLYSLATMERLDVLTSSEPVEQDSVVLGSLTVMP